MATMTRTRLSGCSNRHTPPNAPQRKETSTPEVPRIEEYENVTTVEPPIVDAWWYGTLIWMKWLAAMPWS